MREVWKPVYGFARFYEVSSLGRLRNRKTRRVLAPSEDKDGYLRIHLKGENSRGEPISKSLYVHRLVVTAFVGARPGSGYEVGHRDGNRQNNKKTNLDWVTKTQNARQRKSHGNGGEGEKNPSSKLTEPEVIKIRDRYRLGESATALAREFGVSRVTIYNIINRVKWQHLT